MVQNFYNRLNNNLNSKNIFYKDDREIYHYRNLKEFFYKFVNLVQFLPKKRNKICILSDKCFELYATSLSILISNNTWVPLSKSFPENRIFDVINSVKPDLFIINKLNTIKNLKIKNFLRKNKIPLITFEEINHSKKINKIPNYKYYNKDVSMIFFTSGSTGIPKGVEILNEGYIYSLKEQITNLYKNKKDLVFGDYHDISFVISLNILLPCFYLKGIIVPGINTKDILFPIDHIIKNKVNTLVTVPTTINRIRNYYKNISQKFYLENLILCGEPFYFDLYNYLSKKKISKNIFNCYGSTELSPWVFYHKLHGKNFKIYKKMNLVPIGKKFKEVKTKIIDDILLVGGKTLSRSYLNIKENKNVFIKISGSRYYKTNDIVEIINDNYFVKGRSDSIVKISGQRVELFEIDSVLRKLKLIKNCLVFIKKLNDYEQFICAAIEGNKIKDKEILNYLRKKLPVYMIPKQIQIFNKFPLNKNFKIDRLKIKNSF